MKKRKIVALVIMMLTACMVLTACGKNKQESDDTEYTEDSQKSEKKDRAKKPRKEKNNKTDDSKSMEMYEAFLDGTEKVGISRVDLNSYMYDDSDPSIDSSKLYTMEELLETFFKERLACYDNSYTVDGLEYAFIDMGKDGERELVLHFISNSQHDEYSNIMVIKNVNDMLELCYFTEDGYRAYNYVNQDGIVASGGSGGASVWYDSYRTLDSEGNVIFLYDRESMGAYNVFVNGEDYGVVAEKLGVAEDIAVIRYCLEEYVGGYDDDSYDEYMNNAYYTYEMFGREGDASTPPEIYEKNSKYYKFMNLFSDNVYSYQEMEDIIAKHLEEYNLTKEMLENNDPEWTPWKGHEDLFAATNVEPEVIVIDNPSWEYYATDYPYEVGVDDFVTLSEISHESNDIVDDAEWFDEIGVDMPENGTIKDPGYKYVYELASQYSSYYHEFDTVTIHNNYTDRDEVVLDFSNFIIPDEIAAGDEDFVRECIRYVQAVDRVLYVSIAHRTYAESAPHNAYIMALDMDNNYKVIWKSEPLICNSDNFAIVDGSIICGYGFTNEPDFIYTLNRYTGERMEKIKVKTGPDYFYAIDGKLYVRTYNTNYVYQLSWG